MFDAGVDRRWNVGCSCLRTGGYAAVMERSPLTAHEPSRTPLAITYRFAGATLWSLRRYLRIWMDQFW